MLLDSHCHLTHRLFVDEELDAHTLIKEAQSNGIHECMTICCRIRNEFETDILPTANAHPGVWCTVGTHPHEASNEDYTTQEIIDRTHHDKVIGIGECGLDYFYDLADINDQKRVFRAHIQACLDTDLPIIIHARDADEDIISIIREVDPKQALRGIMHCFSSGAQLAEQALDHGLHLSFSGMLTFKKNKDLRDIAARTPLDRLLVETDAPYLAPEPHRGKLNRPAYVQYTAQCLAEIHDTTLGEMATITRNNFFQLFDKATPLSL